MAWESYYWNGLIFDRVKGKLRVIMENREKLNKMDRALRLLEDLKNSQAALIEKAQQLQMDAMSFNFSEMEKNMGDLSSRYSESLEMLEHELERFSSKRDKFEKDNGLENPAI